MLGFRFWLGVAEHMRLQPSPHISIRFHVFVPCGLKRNRLNHTFYCVALQQGVARGGFVMGLTFSGLANAGETQSPRCTPRPFKNRLKAVFWGLAKTYLPKAPASFFIWRSIAVVGTRFTCAVTPTRGLLG